MNIIVDTKEIRTTFKADPIRYEYKIEQNNPKTRVFWVNSPFASETVATENEKNDAMFTIKRLNNEYGEALRRLAKE